MSVAEFYRLSGPDDPQEALYLRVACLGSGNRSAWSQPSWIV